MPDGGSEQILGQNLGNDQCLMHPDGKYLEFDVRTKIGRSEVASAGVPRQRRA